MAEGGGTVGYLSRPNPNGVSVHFVVEYSGRIVQMLDRTHMHSSLRPSAIRTSDDPPYVVGIEVVRYGRSAAVAILGDWADVAHGTPGPNHATLAVECEGFARTGPNAAQRAAIVDLAADLALPALGHRDFADYKACPGKEFPWPSIGGHAAEGSMKLTDVKDAAGTATMVADGPVWEVATGRRVNAQSGTTWQVVATCKYDSPGQDGDGTSAGYMIAANAPDGELHVVAVVRVRFTPTDLARELTIANRRIVAAITTLGGTPPPV